MSHIPVLLSEALEYLNPQMGDCVVDATAGYGGHSKELAKRVGEGGTVLAIDWDYDAYAALAKERKPIIAVHGSFADIAHIAEQSGCTDISGTLFDFGFSSVQIEGSTRGFSFRELSYGEPLDMRFDASDTSRQTAQNILETYSEDDLAGIFREYGEERYAKGIARHIAQTRQERPVQTVGDLVERIREVTPPHKQRGRIHFATRVFQALRIEVNDELSNIQQGLAETYALLGKQGTEHPHVVAISFHSLEDRIVKHTFRRWEKEGGARVLTKRPVIPTEEEIEKNPRARSAKLRAIEL